MKKIICVILTAILIIGSLSGCFGAGNSNTSSADSQAVSSEVLPDADKHLFYKIADKTLYIRKSERDEYYKAELEADKAPDWTQAKEYNLVTKAVIEEEIYPCDCYFFFYNAVALTEIENIEFLHTCHCKSMASMFEKCYNLAVLDVSSFDTRNLSDMNKTFCGLGLKTENEKVEIKGLENWKTEKVTDMSSAFANGESYTGSGKLTDESLAGIKHWNTAKVTDMTCIFYGQGKNLTRLEIDDWDTSLCESLNHSFCDCNKLISLDLSKWNVGNVKTMCNVFDDCFSLTTLGDISNWDVHNLIDAGGFINGCTTFTGDGNGKLDLSGWVTPELRGMREMFYRTNLLVIDISGLITEKINNKGWEGAGEGIYYTFSTNAYDMFGSCAKLETIYVGSGWNVEKAGTSGMFKNCNIKGVTNK